MTMEWALTQKELAWVVEARRQVIRLRATANDDGAEARLDDLEEELTGREKYVDTVLRLGLLVEPGPLTVGKVLYPNVLLFLRKKAEARRGRSARSAGDA